MKTLILLLLFACLSALAQTNAVHTWHQGTNAISGDYVSAGTTSLVIKQNGTNRFLALFSLSEEDQAYLRQIKRVATKKRLADEAPKLIAKGVVCVDEQIIQQFPERLMGKPLFFDGKFERFWSDSEHPDVYLDFTFTDFTHIPTIDCRAFKISPEGIRQPLADQLATLKEGDRVRVFGRLVDTGTSIYNYKYFVTQFEIIQTAADAKEEQEASNDSQTGLAR